MGRAVIDPLDALKELPEVAAGEPCPVVRIADAAVGWLSVWEVTPDGFIEERRRRLSARQRIRFGRTWPCRAWRPRCCAGAEMVRPRGAVARMPGNA